MSSQGSFRGVPFGIYGHSAEGGRRTVTHEFPNRDLPFTEDMGRKSKSFSLDLFVVGDDVNSQRDALVVALEKKGPGVLVHPFLGTFSVQVSTYTISESFDAARLCRFSVSFVQPGRADVPKATSSASATVSNLSTQASLQAGANAASIDVSSAPKLTAVSSVISSCSSVLQDSARKSALPTSLESAPETDDAKLAMSQFLSDSNSLVSLASTPDVMCYSLADLVFRVSSLGMSSFQAFGTYQRLLDSAIGIFSALNYASTILGIAQSANASLVQDAMLTAIVGSAAANAVDADYSTYDQAIATRAQLSTMFDTVMGVILDDTLFGYLQDLRASSLAVIPGPDISLPNIVTVKAPSPVPSLNLAYSYMGGSADEQTLINLNAVRNPWFVGGQPTLSVNVLQ